MNRPENCGFCDKCREFVGKVAFSSAIDDDSTHAFTVSKYTRLNPALFHFEEVTIKRSRPTAAPQVNTPRMNDRIRISPIRVVNADGEMLGEMETERALAIAQDQGLDLVEVSPEARPPVCRIMDYGKVIYQRQKKTGGSKNHKTQLKQLRLRAKTGAHDIEVKVNKAREFLGRRDKVKINVMFRGRENAHHDRGREMLEEIVKSLQDVATVEQHPKMESGRMMSVLLAPMAK